MLNEDNKKAIIHQVRQSHFYQWGLQYYIAGRFAWFAFLHPITGVLFHHGIEMILKGKLLEIYSEETLEKTFRHHIYKLWNELKKMFPNSNLKKFDSVIQRLNKWVEARYPPSKGYVMYSDFKKGHKSKMTYPKMKEQDQYRVNLEETDELIKIIFDTIPLNPGFFKSILMKSEAKEFYYRENEHLLKFE